MSFREFQLKQAQLGKLAQGITDAVVHRINLQDRNVLILEAYQEGMPVYQIADAAHLSESRIKQIVKS